MSTITKRASFDFIRYANVWEDAETLLRGLRCKEGDKILSIASAGDNSFSLLVTNPSLIVAVDVNEHQLHLTELKRAAIRSLERDECMAFLGFRNGENRIATYHSIKHILTEQARELFDSNLDWIEDGIIDCGKFERYFRIFSKRVMPFIHRKKTTEKLLVPKSQQEQEQFYHNNWNTWQWRLLFKIFFSKQVMGRLGRDPEFLAEVKVPVSKFIFMKAEKHLKSTRAQSNHILRYNLTGSFGLELPHYLREENFFIIKEKIDKLQLFKGYAEEAIAEYGKFDAMNMSNIFEYMPQDVFKNTGAGLVAGLNQSGRIAYWNLMVPRRLSKAFHELEYKKELSHELTAEDKGFFYHSIIIENKK